MDAWQRGEGVLFATISSFKGLEADAIIITDLKSIAGTPVARSELYVACSRAKHLLHLYYSEARGF
jgi:DNA helicase IV